MPEPLLHFIIPLFLLIMLGFNLKKSIIISSLAIIPDLDVIFHVHRSISHSIIFILALTIPTFLILNYLNIGKKSEMMTAILVILSHPFMDLFTGYTPIFWPLFDKSIYIFTQLTTNMNNVLDLNLIFKVNFDKIMFLRTTDGDAPIFTSQGFGITLVLLIGFAMKSLSTKTRDVVNLMRYNIIDIEKRKKIK
jgi:membrane-bound metal-dependent hydrolase YbcI (DUF457 family)